MSMFDKSYCATECNRTDCERNLKFHKPATKIYTATMFDQDNPDPEHYSCKNRYPMTNEVKAERYSELLMENNDLKEQLKHYIPRRRVRRVFNLLKDILEIDLTDERMRYVKILQDFVKKIETEGDQVAGQDIKTAIQYLLSIREVD